MSVSKIYYFAIGFPNSMEDDACTLAVALLGKRAENDAKIIVFARNRVIVRGRDAPRSHFYKCVVPGRT